MSQPRDIPLWCGRNEPRPVRRTLLAGPLPTLLAGADVSCISVGKTEIIRRIHFGVCDVGINLASWKRT